MWFTHHIYIFEEHNCATIKWAKFQVQAEGQEHESWLWWLRSWTAWGSFAPREAYPNQAPLVGTVGLAATCRNPNDSFTEPVNCWNAAGDKIIQTNPNLPRFAISRFHDFHGIFTLKCGFFTLISRIFTAHNLAKISAEFDNLCPQNIFSISGGRAILEFTATPSSRNTQANYIL